MKTELFHVNDGLTTSLVFFSENAKNLGRSDDAKQRKKRMALSFILSFNLIKNQFFLNKLSVNLIKNQFFYLSLCIG